MMWDLVIAIGVPLLAFMVGAWKFLYNHVEHLRQEVREDFALLRSEIRELRDILLRR